MQRSLQCILLKCLSMHMVSHMRDCSVLAGSLTQLTAEVSVSLLASAGRTIVFDWWGSIMKHYTVCMCASIHAIGNENRRGGWTAGACPSLLLWRLLSHLFSLQLKNHKTLTFFLHETWWNLFSYQYEDKISLFFFCFFVWSGSFWSWGVVSLLVSRTSLSGEQAIPVDCSSNTC